MRHIFLAICFPLAVGLFNSIAPSAEAVMLSLTDDFEDGTTMGWGHGKPSPNPPVVIPTGGPDGNDAYLKIAATGGFGAGSRLLALNTQQWNGDYLSAGINTIAADVRNPGSTPLELRVAFNGSGGWFVSDNPYMLAANSGWLSAIFPITEAALTTTGGGTYEDTITNVSEMRILHNTSPAHQGAKEAAEFHVDNLRAVPEPASLAMSILAFLAVSARMRCKKDRFNN